MRLGHEDDYVISDLVADLRGLTPSEGAEKVTPDCAAVMDWLEKLETRLRGLLMKHLEIRPRPALFFGQPALLHGAVGTRPRRGTPARRLGRTA